MKLFSLFYIVHQVVLSKLDDYMQVNILDDYLLSIDIYFQQQENQLYHI
jgi:hypothetical protein